MTKSTLEKLLTRTAILDLAGDVYFDRGIDYFTGGAVEELTEANSVIKARVAGTYDYRTKIWVDENDLDYSCSCPLGQDYEFCKHLVATGLTWLQQQKDTTQIKQPNSSTPQKAKKTNVFDSIRDYLQDLPQEQLVDIIIEQTKDHDYLKNLLYAQSNTAPGADKQDLEVHKQFIQSVIEVDDFVDYRHIYAYVEAVQPVVELLQTLLKRGRAEDVVELTQYALLLTFEAYNNMDDDGDFSPIAEEIAELHLTACNKARLAPEQLAKSLFELQMQDGWGFVDFRNYQKALGKKGLQEFNTLAQLSWRNVPARTQKDKYRYDSNRYPITTIMTDLAELDNDTDALVEIKKRDLSGPHNYYDIASTYLNAKRYDEALQWAQQGIKAFPDRHNVRLIEFIAQEYHRRKQHDKAQQLMWDELARAPDLRTYQALKASADKTKAWEFWRKKAINWITKEYLTGQYRRTNTKHPSYKPSDHSILVEIYLWENDTAKALQAAKNGGCMVQLWFNLANACESSAPQEAINIYQAKIGGIINQTNNKAYDRAAHLLKIIKKLMTRLGKGNQFDKYINQLRIEYKPKRNFIKKIEKI
jgi:uncharacterized Zn finger protein